MVQAEIATSTISWIYKLDTELNVGHMKPKIFYCFWLSANLNGDKMI